ncbi:hypothetical protein PVAP13_7KG032800 [Panicum virgatum]|uniref:Uncharacterized protein n=1 Tax=Panicum virgatum TaxID=38727 RepID=A0A8T0QAI2_PANVG|nr:hypothetical protein PVAP13_7KG032800 [Panicum virgatum]
MSQLFGKKVGCAPRAREPPCAPCRDAVDLQSNGERAERLGSSFSSFPCRARLGSGCLYGSASFSSLSFPPFLFSGSHRRSRRVLRSRRCPRSRAPEPPSPWSATSASPPGRPQHRRQLSLSSDASSPPGGPASRRPGPLPLRHRCPVRAQARPLLPSQPAAILIRPCLCLLNLQGLRFLETQLST